MSEDYAIVVRRANRHIWHEPAAESTRDDPVPRCVDQYAASDPDWDTRRREIATAWYEKCAYCSGAYEAATDQASLPTSTEVPSDD